METREVDVHFQQNLKDQSKPDFLSKAMFYKTGKYYITYRSLYSKDINNMFMAGRCFSTSHVGLGGPRVMRTTGQMGAAVGLAAATRSAGRRVGKECVRRSRTWGWTPIIQK